MKQSLRTARRHLNPRGFTPMQWEILITVALAIVAIFVFIAVFEALPAQASSPFQIRPVSTTTK